MRGTASPKIPATVGDLPADWHEWPDDLENDTPSEKPSIELLVCARAQLCRQTIDLLHKNGDGGKIA
jgi:hypothetical protein